MARALATLLGAEARYVCYESPGLVADAAERDEWDVALIGAEPQRAAVIAFAPAYTEIEASYLVPQDSEIRDIAQIDRPGIRIAVADRTAYGLWLDRNIASAELDRTKTIDEAAEVFAARGLEALAGLRPRLISDVKTLPNTRILEGRFMAVQQAVAPHPQSRSSRSSAEFREGSDQKRICRQPDREARCQRAHSRRNPVFMNSRQPSRHTAQR